LFFIVYDAVNFLDVKTFISVWRDLAKKNGLNDF